jgi:nicotinamidase-related amidase
MTEFAPFPLLSAKQSHLVVIDVQEKLLPSIGNHRNVTNSIHFLMDAALLLDIPVIVTEQYPKGLGPTVDPLRSHPAVAQTLEKLRFSAAEILMSDVSAFELPGTNARRHHSCQIVLVGIEAHVCVQQTALELREQGFQVFIAADCVGSRFPDDQQWGLHRMAAAGVIIATAEAIAFEWCEHAGHERFKSLSRLIRERDAKRNA